MRPKTPWTEQQRGGLGQGVAHFAFGASYTLTRAGRRDGGQHEPKVLVWAERVRPGHSQRDGLVRTQQGALPALGGRSEWRSRGGWERAGWNWARAGRRCGESRIIFQDEDNIIMAEFNITRTHRQLRFIASSAAASRAECIMQDPLLADRSTAKSNQNEDEEEEWQREQAGQPA
jgi:hypothetical protein